MSNVQSRQLRLQPPGHPFQAGLFTYDVSQYQQRCCGAGRSKIADVFAGFPFIQFNAYQQLGFFRIQNIYLPPAAPGTRAIRLHMAPGSPINFTWAIGKDPPSGEQQIFRRKSRRSVWGIRPVWIIMATLAWNGFPV